jgi:chromosome segregation ATPase
MHAPDEQVGENPTTADTTGTRSVFQSLLDSIKTLSQDRTFPSILISMEKVPAMEDEIKRLKDEEKISAQSQRQLLETFNQDRDAMKAKQKQLQEEKTALYAEIVKKADSAKTHEAAKKQQSDQIQSLKETEVILREDLDRKAKQIQGLVKAIETEKQKSRSLQASLDVQTGESTNKTTELQQLHKIHQKLQYKADWDAKELRTISELSIPLTEEPPK